MIEDDWIEHRRGMDRELIGWLAPLGGGWVAIDLLGRRRTDVLELDEAEGALEEIGIGYLADPYELKLPDGRWLRVRITEVSRERIALKREDFGAMDVPAEHFEVGMPMPPALRPLGDNPELKPGELFRG